MLTCNELKGHSDSFLVVRHLGGVVELSLLVPEADDEVSDSSESYGEVNEGEPLKLARAGAKIR